MHGTINSETLETDTRRQSRLRRILLWAGAILAVLAIALLIAGDILLHRAGPMLKAKVVETLSTRFDSRVELQRFQVSLVKGFEVSGSGLKLYPNHLSIDGPMIEVDQFSFHALNWKQLFKTPMFISRVEVKGLSIHIPPKDQRADMPHLSKPQGEDESHSGIKVEVGEILVNRADLVIENGKPNKVPLNFVIHKLVLRSVAAGQPMKFHAILVNPRPIGNIDSSGDFGPFDTQSPGDTRVRGSYTFRHADLNTIKGIGGMLASTGKYEGQLNNIVVDGETTTPDFSLDTADHPVPLHTKFHAIVDGTNGDTYLQPVDAWLRHTHIVAIGEVVKIPGMQGRDIRLEVTVGPGQIQDLLQLAVKDEPPLMNGRVTLHTQFDLPPGPQDVTQKLRLKGGFQLLDIHFSNAKIQSKVDELSLRGQGKAHEAKEEGAALKNGNQKAATAADIASEMRGNFNFGNGQLSVPTLNYRVPGANIQLGGVYQLASQSLNFTGTARLDAHVSQMVTGWKSWLLKPVDPFFAKNGAGTQVPIKVSGSSSHPEIGLNF